MLNIQLPTFKDVREELAARIIQAPAVRTERWQGRDVSSDPAATTYEIRNVDFEVPLQGITTLQHWRDDIQPNLPWADDHFLERIGGEPLNPGVEWANWPWASSANKFRTVMTGNMPVRFNHTYMERLWPKWANKEAVLSHINGSRRQPDRKNWVDPHQGLRYSYGDLEDVVRLLRVEPFTRQAYIPLFFPEDTGVGDGGRKVCTLGYQFLVRINPDHGFPEAHIWYPLRSCDLIRHWADDCYLAVRLLLWVIDRCRQLNAADKDSVWHAVTPGTYAMHMTSLHIFENDKRTLTNGHV